MKAEICGTRTVGGISLPPTRTGCGGVIRHRRDVYRCTDCDTPMHKTCARAHFATNREASVDGETHGRLLAAHARIARLDKQIARLKSLWSSACAEVDRCHEHARKFGLPA